MGTYGMLRFCLPLFPDASREFAPIICVLAIVGIIYGALVAMVQPDLKKLVAYSSVAHLGFCVLGIFVFRPEAMEGAIYQMFSHGVSTGALFMLVGMLYERRHTRLISEFGGLATSVPVYSTFFLIVVLSSLGLPLLNGFVGEFLIIVGSYYRHAAYAALAAAGVVLAAVYLLWMYQRVFYGEITNEKNRTLPDCDWREKLILTSHGHRDYCHGRLSPALLAAHGSRCNLHHAAPRQEIFAFNRTIGPPRSSESGSRESGIENCGA